MFSILNLRLSFSCMDLRIYQYFRTCYDTASSLSDELDNANNELDNANTEENGETEELRIKLDILNKKMKAQKDALATTLFKLKEKEVKDNTDCNCKKVLFGNKKKLCRINHFRFNWKRSFSIEVFEKLGRGESGEEMEI